MKTLHRQKNIEKPRFAACGNGARLLINLSEAAGRAPASESVSPVQLSAGGFFNDRLTSGSRRKINLTRCEIFRGKVPLRQTQK